MNENLFQYLQIPLFILAAHPLPHTELQATLALQTHHFYPWLGLSSSFCCFALYCYMETLLFRFPAVKSYSVSLSWEWTENKMYSTLCNAPPPPHCSLLMAFGKQQREICSKTTSVSLTGNDQKHWWAKHKPWLKKKQANGQNTQYNAKTKAGELWQLRCKVSLHSCTLQTLCCLQLFMWKQTGAPLDHRVNPLQSRPPSRRCWLHPLGPDGIM